MKIVLPGLLRIESGPSSLDLMALGVLRCCLGQGGAWESGNRGRWNGTRGLASQNLWSMFLELQYHDGSLLTDHQSSSFSSHVKRCKGVDRRDTTEACN